MPRDDYDDPEDCPTCETIDDAERLVDCGEIYCPSCGRLLIRSAPSGANKESDRG